jgi:hypothetical protein
MTGLERKFLRSKLSPKHRMTSEQSQEALLI